MTSTPDDPRRGPRRYGPGGGDRPVPQAPMPPPAAAPTQGDRGRAWQAWSDLEADNPPTAILPTGFNDSAPRPAAGSHPAGRPVSYRGTPPVPAPAPVFPPAPGPAPVFPPAAPAGVPPTRRRTPGYVLAGRIVSATVAAAVLAVFAFYWGFASKATAEVANSQGVNQAGEAGVVFRGGENILLVGSDARTDADGNPLTADQLAAVSTTLDDGGVNTDTIMVMHIPQGGGKATAVSIPRDTWMPLSVTNAVTGPYNDGTSGTYKPNKINSFYGTAKAYTEQALAAKGQGESPARERASNEAGRTMLIKIVQAFTGLKIDHYAEVNLIGFYTLSNAVGGVPVCLNEAVNDPYSGAVFAAGPQDVQGKTAMSFVRQRHGLPNGDLDRVRRQQAFLAGATSKMLSAGVLANPSKLNQLADAANKSLTLDSGFDLLTFAQQMAGLSGGNVIFTTIPTHGASTETSKDALATDPVEIKKFFTALDGGASSGSAASSSAGPAASTAVSSAAFVPSTVTVDVKDATSGHRSGTPVLTKLKAAGFKAGVNTDFDGSNKTTTLIEYGAGGAAGAAAVKAALGGAGTLTSNTATASHHVTVIVGEDLAASGLRMAGGALAAAGPTSPVAGSAASSITAGGIQCVN